MYILKRILISLHKAVFFIEILLKHYRCMRIHLLSNFFANDAFQKLRYQRQAGYL